MSSRYVPLLVALACAVGCGPLLAPGSTPQPGHALVLLKVSANHDLFVEIGGLGPGGSIDPQLEYDFNTEVGSRYIMLEVPAGKYRFNRFAKEGMMLAVVTESLAHPFEVGKNELLYLGDFAFQDSPASLHVSVACDPAAATGYLATQYPGITKQMQLVLGSCKPQP